MTDAFALARVVEKALETLWHMDGYRDAVVDAVLSSDWLAGVKAEAWDEGEANVYIGKYDQYDTGSLMTRATNPYRTPEAST